MLRHLARMSQKASLPPGSLIHVGSETTEPTTISVLDYDQESFEKTEVAQGSDLARINHLGKITWFKVKGVHEPEVIEQVGKIFGLHPLVMEDILNSQQRPKLENFDDYMYLACKAMERVDGEVRLRHISIVLGKGFVLTFQDADYAHFGPLVERIAGGKGRIRRMGADYLACAMLDMIVDGYFEVMEWLGEKLEEVEDIVLSKPSKDTLEQLYELKKEALELRKAVWPMREVTAGLARGESELISENTVPFFRDVYDHTIQVIDTSETLRESLATLKDVYLSSISNHMNQIMKVLTIIATLFIPLTFLAGIYGMNFENMPELEQPWAYPALLGLMLVVALVMLSYFWRKKWF